MCSKAFSLALQALRAFVAFAVFSVSAYAISMGAGPATAHASPPYTLVVQGGIPLEGSTLTVK